MKLTLAYGKKGLPIDIPDGLDVTVYRKKPMPKAADPDEAVAAALRAPIGTPPLSVLAAGKHSACIVINDITRPVPNRLILPHLIGELRSAGMKDIDIFLLNATGTHRPADLAEKIELVGEDILAHHQLFNHYAGRDDDHCFVCTTDAGTDVFLDSRYIDSEIKILTGLIEPHFMAGYSGGRKALCPGLASIKTVKAIHHPRFMEAPRAANSILDNNPLHDELSGIARRAGVDFILNVVIDEDRDVCGVFAGDCDEAHAAGAAFARRYDTVPADAPANIVITSSAGYPLDKTFYQAVKGICGVAQLIKPGGDILIAAACGEGMGNDSFCQGLRLRASFATHDEYIAHIAQPENFLPDQWQVEKLSQALTRGRVLLFSDGLSDADFALTLAEKIKSIEAGLALCLQKQGPSATIAIVPEGPYVIPYIQG